MRGSSGATLQFSGDFLEKRCSDAREQCEWFKFASSYSLAAGIRLPRTRLISEDRYVIEFIEGVCGTYVDSTRLIDTLVDQINLWATVPSVRSLDWASYKQRLRDEHVCLTDSYAVAEAYRLVDSWGEFPSSFAHGDLTLENLLIENDGRVVLIDPNFKSNLFQSYLLDLGKLMQSVHSDYHRVFNSHPGCNPAYLCEHLRTKVSEKVWAQGLVAELTHLIRLRKYRPESQRKQVDECLERVIREVGLLS